MSKSFVQFIEYFVDLVRMSFSHVNFTNMRSLCAMEKNPLYLMILFSYFSYNHEKLFCEIWRDVIAFVFSSVCHNVKNKSLSFLCLH